MNTRFAASITVAAWILALPAALAQSIPPAFPDPMAMPYTAQLIFQPCGAFAADDFDGDGAVDIAMSAGSLNELRVYRGHGRDGLMRAWTNPIAASARRIESADMNGDGSSDLVTTNASGKVVVWLANGGGGFTALPQVGFGPLSDAFALALGDLDADGDPDVVVGDNYWKALRFLRNDGNGNLAFYLTEPLVTEPRSVELGRIDGNASLDVAVGCYAVSGELRACFNDGAGFFPTTTSVFFGQHMSQVQIADFNGDANQDLSWRSYLPGGSFQSVMISDGDGAGGFATPVALGFSFDNTSQWTEHGDLDNDGDQDLVTSDQHSYFFVLRNDGGGVFTRIAEAAVDSNYCRLVDFDADGILDLVLGGDNIQVLFGDGQAGFTPTPTQILFREPGRQLVHADFDLDGNQDEVAGSYGDGMSFVTICYGDGQGAISSVLDVPLGRAGWLANPAVSDWDGDGDPDLAAGTNGAVMILRNDSGLFSVVATIDVGAGERRVEGADFDADGFGDFLVVNRGANTHTLYRSDGTGNFSVLHSSPYSLWPMSSAVGDLNGDARPDFAIGTMSTSYNAGAIHVWLSQGGTYVPLAATYAFSTGVLYLALGDLDGDGDLDLATRADASQSYGGPTYLNNGSGMLLASTFVSMPPGSKDLRVADMDSDGDADIVSFDYHLNRAFTVFESVGVGAFLPGATYFIGGMNYGDVVDMNNDGRMDVAAVYFDYAAGATALRVMLQSPVFVTSYCTPKINSLGCAPAITHSGTPSASAGSGFMIGADRILANKPGLFLYGFGGPTATSFQGGTLCLKAPIKRVSGPSSGGAAGCTGSFATDFNVRIASGVDPALIAGERICGQWWSRDNGFAAPNNSSLTDAVEFTIQP